MEERPRCSYRDPVNEKICRMPGRFQENGRPYCKRHHPQSVRDREQLRQVLDPKRTTQAMEAGFEKFNSWARSRATTTMMIETAAKDWVLALTDQHRSEAAERLRDKVNILIALEKERPIWDGFGECLICHRNMPIIDGMCSYCRHTSIREHQQDLRCSPSDNGN